MTKHTQPEHSYSPELTRLAEAIGLLDRLRSIFYEMDDAGERDRAWRYLADRFGEFDKAEMPAWEVIEAEATS